MTTHSSLEEKQAAMRARMAAQQQEQKCKNPTCSHKARDGQPYCSRCTTKGIQEKLRDTLPGMESEEGKAVAELEQNKAGSQPSETVIYNEPSLSNERSSDIPKQYARMEVARITGVSMPTLIRWEKLGYVSPRRLDYGNKVIYSEEDLQKVLERKRPHATRKSERPTEAAPPPKPGTIDSFAASKKAKFTVGRKVEKSVARRLDSLGGRGLV